MLSYFVRALDGDGDEGGASAPVRIAVPLAADRAGAPAPPAALGAPAGLDAQSAAGHVSLQWQAVPGATGYRVERAWSADGPYAPLAVTPLTLFTDQAPPVGGQAWYRVSALGGDPSAAVPALLLAGTAAQPLPAGATGPLPEPPPAVSAPQAVVEGDAVRVTWMAVQAATYDVYRYNAAALSFELAASGLTGTSFLDEGLATGSYGYVVTAVDGFGQESRYSSAAWVDLPTAGTAGSALRADTLLVGQSVAFQAPAGASGGSVTFEIGPAGGAFTPLPAVRGPAPSRAGGAGVMPATGDVWSAAWNTSGLAAGAYTLRTRFTDAAGTVAETLRTLRLDAPLARGPPAPGFTLQAITAAGGIDLTWDGAPVANVQVMRSAAGPDGPFEAIAQTSSRSFEDRHLIPEIPYHYVVASAGAFSEPVEATPAAPSTTSGNLSVDLPASSASRLTLDLAPSLSPPPLAAGLTLLGSAFSIDATSLATGSAVHLLNETASVTFQVATGMQGPLTIYHWDGAGWAAMLLPRPSTCRRPSRAAPASSINARSASTATWASSTAECRTFCRRVGPGASVRPATNRSPSPTSSRRGPEHRPYST